MDSELHMFFSSEVDNVDFRQRFLVGDQDDSRSTDSTDDLGIIFPDNLQDGHHSSHSIPERPSNLSHGSVSPFYSPQRISQDRLDIHLRTSVDTLNASFTPDTAFRNSRTYDDACHNSGRNLPPVLSCPPSWLGMDSQSDFEEEEDGEVDYCAIQQSSSPLVAASSSPYTDDSSERGRNTSSTLATTISLGYCSSPSAGSSSSCSTRCSGPGSNSDEFATKLHALLLIVFREREARRCQDPLSSLGGSDTTRSGSFGSDASSDLSAENQPISFSQNIGDPDIINTDPSRRSSPLVLNKWFANQSHRSGGPPETTSLPEISPILFEERTEVEGPAPPLSGTEQVSSRHSLKRPKCEDGEDELTPDTQPLQKRPKFRPAPVGHAKGQLYAPRTASLRRAESLKAVETSTTSDWTETVPATPIPQSARPVLPANTSASAEPLMPPVPIIAPPPDYVARFSIESPPSPETFAKLRMRSFLQRERDLRAEEGLDTGDVGISSHPPLWMLNEDTVQALDRGDHKFVWETVLGVGRERREKVVNWLLDVIPAPESSSGDSDSVTASTASNSSSQPSRASSSSLTRTSSIVTTATSSTSTTRGSNLYDQLLTSPDTRFHAVWLFLRYFYLTMSSDLCSGMADGGFIFSPNPKLSQNTEDVGLDLIVWDVAVACLAISVKFHRDFLDPLLPVYANEYLSLAPHDISYENLEVAQRDVWSACDYRLGSTPQLMMEELWAALPSLRNLLDFEGGWRSSTREAWQCLFVALCEPDVLRFPVSMLTTVALMEGIVDTLIKRILFSNTVRSELWPSARTERGGRTVATATATKARVLSMQRRAERSARRAAEAAFCDIQMLVGVTDHQLMDCRLWMTRSPLVYGLD